jgi:hypothetical protein
MTNEIGIKTRPDTNLITQAAKKRVASVETNLPNLALQKIIRGILYFCLKNSPPRTSQGNLNINGVAAISG